MSSVQIVRFFVVLWTFSLFLTSCSERDSRPANPPSDYDLPSAVFDDQSTPRVDVPDLEDERAALSPPLLQIGGDTGDEGLVYAGALGGYYILRTQLANGSFNYRFDPEANTWADDDNLARQSGATYTLSYLYAITQREEFRIAAEWSHNRIAEQMPVPLQSSAPTALRTLGLILHSSILGTTEWGDFDVQAEIDGLGAFILGVLNEDGNLQGRGFHAGGQYMQSLWSLYAFTGDERYLDAVESSARFFLDSGEHEFDLLFGLWANEPLTHLYRLRPQEWILDLVWKVSDPILDQQILSHHDVSEEWIGGFLLYDQSTPGALSMYGTEAAIDGWRLAVLSGDTARAERYRNAAVLGAQFLKRLQFREGDTDRYAQGEMMIGGVPYGLARPILRVDITRHLINTFFKIVTYLDHEEYPAKGKLDGLPNPPTFDTLDIRE